MDPLSIAASCVALTGITAKIGTEITRFVVRYREFKDDLTGLSRLITELNLALSVLNDDLDPVQGECRVPSSFRPHLTPMLDNCQGILSELQSLFGRYTSRSITMGDVWERQGPES